MLQLIKMQKRALKLIGLSMSIDLSVHMHICGERVGLVPVRFAFVMYLILFLLTKLLFNSVRNDISY
jgi:hypothetical protein